MPNGDDPKETHVYWSSADLFDRVFGELHQVSTLITDKAAELSVKIDQKSDKSDIASLERRITDHIADDLRSFSGVTAALEVLQSDRKADRAATKAVSGLKTKWWAIGMGLSGVASTIAICLSVVH
jgi:hypothetical protein